MWRNYASILLAYTIIENMWQNRNSRTKLWNMPGKKPKTWVCDIDSSRQWRKHALLFLFALSPCAWGCLKWSLPEILSCISTSKLEVDLRGFAAKPTFSSCCQNLLLLLIPYFSCSSFPSQPQESSGTALGRQRCCHNKTGSSESKKISGTINEQQLWWAWPPWSIWLEQPVYKGGRSFHVLFLRKTGLGFSPACTCDTVLCKQTENITSVHTTRRQTDPKTWHLALWRTHVVRTDMESLMSYRVKNRKISQ